jgi:hypothetical protein
MRSNNVMRHSVRGVIKAPKDEHRPPMALIGCQPAPTQRLLIVLRQALPSLGHLAEFVLSIAVSLHGSEPIPADGFKITLRHSDAPLVSHAELVLIFGGSFLGVFQ